jgi:hypothetical protein
MSTIKLVPTQPNTMEVIFTCLEALMMSMVAKLQQFLAHQTTNMACVVPNVVVVCNEKGIFS